MDKLIIDIAVTTLFWQHWDSKPSKLLTKIAKTDTGPYLFFRRNKSAIQTRLMQLLPHGNIPRVLLHGSPHIDNYAKTAHSFGMVDFDRAYIGPYIWDIVCVLLAIALRNPDTQTHALSKVILNAFSEQYQHHYQHPTLAYQAYAPLENITPKAWEQNSRLYIEGKHKWAKKLYQHKVSLQDPLTKALYDDFIKNGETTHQLADYHPTHIARAAGSFGRQRYLYLLENALNQPIILDIKETRNYLDAAWPHNRWYQTPYAHDGQRMIKAAKLYAPDSLQFESFATLNGVQYWGRQIPTLNYKPSKLFTEADQLAFAKSAGSQLGRGHSLGGMENTLTHFAQNMTQLAEITEQIKKELLTVWRQSIKDSLLVG